MNITFVDGFGVVLSAVTLVEIHPSFGEAAVLCYAEDLMKRMCLRAQRNLQTRLAVFINAVLL